MKAADGSNYVKLGRKWYELNESASSFDTIYEDKLREFASLEPVIQEAKEVEFKKLIVKDNHGSEFYPVIYTDKWTTGQGSILFRSVDGKDLDTPGWSLDSVLYGDKFSGPSGDKLYIDMGSKWYLTGLNNIWKKLKKKYPKKLDESANKKLIGKTVKVNDPDNDLKGWTFQHGDKVKVLKYTGEQGPYGAEYEVTDGKSTAMLTTNYLEGK